MSQYAESSYEDYVLDTKRLFDIVGRVSFDFERQNLAGPIALVPSTVSSYRKSLDIFARVVSYSSLLCQ
jgi:hypothetical protein